VGFVPAWPQAPQVACSHTVPGPSQAVPAAKQVELAPAVTQHAFASVQLPEQHSCVAPPQFVHLPPVQMFSWPPLPVVHAVLFETHVSFAESQQPVPVHAVPVRQHGPFLAPHTVQAPPKQTSLPLEHALSGPTQVLFAASQQAPAAAQALLAQHAEPVAPQVVQVPPVQMLVAPASLVVQAVSAATHLSVMGSQQPPVHGVAPAQHASPVLPQTPVSAADSFGASTGPSVAAASVGPSVAVPPSASTTGPSVVASFPPLEVPSLAASPPLEDVASATASPPEEVPSCEAPSLPLLAPPSPDAPSTVPSPVTPPSSGDVSKAPKSLVQAANARAMDATTEAIRIDFIASLSTRGNRVRPRAQLPLRVRTWNRDSR
jgi:hypothetical protein